MSSGISATSSASIADSIFSKLDTKKKGYIDATDLTSAAGTDGAAASKAADLIKQVDSNADGKVTKSELSAAIDKVSDQLNAQLDQSRTANATAGAKPATGGEAHGGGGAPPSAASGGSDSATAAKYVAAADTNGDGTVSADEEAAYKKAQAASAEATALAQVQEYKNNSGDSAAVPSAAVDTSA